MGATVLLAVAFLPTLAGYGTSIVTSGSMGTAAPVGSVVQTKMAPIADVRVGDVITYRSPGVTRSITHRVIDIARVDGRLVLRTKGDANATPDPEPVVLRARVARVERVVPLAGYVVRFARTPAGWVALLLVPLAGLFAEAPLRRRRGIHARQA